MSRVQKTIKNGYVAVAINLLTLFIAFFSRRVFIEHLGLDLLGLNSTLSSILGLLNLAEMGVFVAVGYALYKPIAQNNHEQINKIMSLLCYLYRKIGIAITIVAIALAPFLPLIFADKGVGLTQIYFGYFIFLISNLFSYFFNYKQGIFVANQQNWVISSTNMYVVIAKTLLQIAAVFYIDVDANTKFAFFLILELLAAIFFTIFINRKVKAKYPWLECCYKVGKECKREFSSIFTNIKRVFANKISYFVLTQTDSVLISIITSSFSLVALVDNYQLIFNRLSRILLSAFDNVSAGVGNLIAEGNDNKVFGTYKQLHSVFMLMGGVTVIGGFYLTDPFISIWLGGGSEYMLDNKILWAILANVYIVFMRRPETLFIEAYGLFHDVPASIAEMVINLGLSIFLGYKIGVLGVMIGTTVATTLIGILWRPYFLFSAGFKLPLTAYWRRSAKLIAITIAVWLLTHYCCSFVNMAQINNFKSWFIFSTTLAISASLLLWGGFYLTDSGMKDITHRIYKGIRNKIGCSK